MKLKEFIEKIIELVDKNPNSLDLDVVYSRDDEGNGYNPVFFSPSVGFYDGERDGDFEPFDESSGEGTLNAICIN